MAEIPFSSPRRHKPSLASDFVIQGLATLSTSLTSLALMPLVLKTSGAGTFGSFILSSSLVTLIVPFLGLGLGYKARRLLPNLQDRSSRSAIFATTASAQLLTHGVAVLVMFEVFPLLQRTLFGGEEILGRKMLLLVTASAYLTTITEDYFRYTHRIRIIAIFGVLRAVAYPTLVLGWKWCGGHISVDSLFMCQSVAGVFFCGILLARIAAEIPLPFQLDTWTQHWEDVRFGFPLISTVIIESLLAASDRYILALYFSPTSVGIYASACGIGALPLIFAKVSTGVLCPAMAKAVDQGNSADAEAMLEKTLSVFLALSLPFAFGAAVLASPVLHVLGNSEVATRGRFVLPMIAIATIVYGYRYIIFSAVFVGMKTQLWLKANIIAGCLSIGANLLLLSPYPYLEVAAAVSIVCHTVSLLLICRSRALNWRFGWSWTYLWRIFGSTGAMFVSVALGLRLLAGQISDLALLAVCAPLGVGIYGCMVLLTRAIPLSDLLALASNILPHSKWAARCAAKSS